MERVTISLDDDLLAEFDAYLARKGYGNRSEGIRDLLRERLEHDRVSEGTAKNSVACLSYVYNHHVRELSQRLATAQHGNHDLILSTLHVHLDHDNCLEVAIMKGPTREVQSLAEATIAETGVRHGNLHLIPSEMATAGRDPTRHSHSHDVVVP